MNTEVIGLVGGITGISAAVPQIYKCLRTKQTRDLSYGTNIVSYVGSSISMYYGVLIGHSAIVACNLYSMLVNTTLLCTKLYFEVLCTGSKDNTTVLDRYTQLENGDQSVL
jgi:uncharacterized protein with PQ loop repeat